MKTFIVLLTLVLFVGCIDDIYEHPSKYMTMKSMDQVEVKRAEMIKILFNQDSLPEETIEGDTVYMDYTLTSKFDYYDNGNNNLIIFHRGHGDDLFRCQDFIDGSINKGYDVVVFSMPLKAPNYNSNFESHNDIGYTIGVKNGHFIRYFIYPVIVFLNTYAEKYDNIIMSGVSGGGWSTVMMAAIDNRIDYSFPVAGSIPLYMRDRSIDSWDNEQDSKSFYSKITYLDMYAMANDQIQINNAFDPCCYSNYSNRLSHYRYFLKNFSKGSWDQYIDFSHREHDFSKTAQEIVFNYLDGKIKGGK